MVDPGPFERQAAALVAALSGLVQDLIRQGISDADLEYLRSPSSFRSVSLQWAEDPYLEAEDPGAVGASVDPILIQVVEGRAFLTDGRHRWLAARLHGADRIAARIEEMDGDGNVVSEWDGELAVRDLPDEALIQFAEQVRAKED